MWRIWRNERDCNATWVSSTSENREKIIFSRFLFDIALLLLFDQIFQFLFLLFGCILQNPFPLTARRKEV